MEQMTAGQKWAEAIIHAANRKAVHDHYFKSRPVSTRAMKRAAMSREERKFKYADVLRMHFQSRG